MTSLDSVIHSTYLLRVHVKDCKGIKDMRTRPMFIICCGKKHAQKLNFQSTESDSRNLCFGNTFLKQPSKMSQR